MISQKWQIREATIGDASGLRACMNAAYIGYQERMSGELLPPMQLDYGTEIENFPTWVAVTGNVVVGGLTMMFTESMATIANIAVHPQFQGQGLGGGLMRFAETQVKERHYDEVRLATHVLLHENLSLYRHLGWSEYDRDDVKVYMKKVIDA